MFTISDFLPPATPRSERCGRLQSGRWSADDLPGGTECRRGVQMQSEQSGRRGRGHLQTGSARYYYNSLDQRFATLWAVAYLWASGSILMGRRNARQESKSEELMGVSTTCLLRPNIVQLENLTREEGSIAEMECRAEGVPRPGLSIRRDNLGLLQDGQDERIVLEKVEEGEYSILRLRITGLKRSDDGLYFCQASNAAGNAEKAGHIEVHC
ncbi:hypothetical protein AVEN_256854-1, partial [Araneus ventricosus]